MLCLVVVLQVLSLSPLQCESFLTLMTSLVQGATLNCQVITFANIFYSYLPLKTL
jgi:hypothetical protein